MKRFIKIILFTVLVTTSWFVQAQQAASSSFFRPSPPNYDVKQAFEVEAVPVFYFTGGYHVSVGYRFRKFRVRLSTVSSGTYDEEPKDKDNFKRLEKDGTFGVFVGYFPWKNLETYAFTDRNVMTITQEKTNESKVLRAFTPGLGVGYQFFIGRYFYLQPAIHCYFRPGNSMTFSNGVNYTLSGTEFTPSYDWEYGWPKSGINFITLSEQTTASRQLNYAWKSPAYTTATSGSSAFRLSVY